MVIDVDTFVFFFSCGSHQSCKPLGKQGAVWETTNTDDVTATSRSDRHKHRGGGSTDLLDETLFIYTAPNQTADCLQRLNTSHHEQRNNFLFNLEQIPAHRWVTG